MSREPFSFSTRAGPREGVTVLTLSGPLNLNTIFGFQADFRALRPPVLILDLSTCPSMDSAGLGLVINQFVSAVNAQRTFLLAGINPRVQALMELARVWSILKIFPTVAGAEAWVVASGDGGRPDR